MALFGNSKCDCHLNKKKCDGECLNMIDKDTKKAWEIQTKYWKQWGDLPKPKKRKK